MKLTLLEIVQDMLTAIDAENVTDVGDTDEAGMCVNIANRSFEDMSSNQRWRHLRQYSTLDTSTYLNEMAVPAGTIALDPYNVYYAGTIVSYLQPEDFLAYTISRDTTASNVTELNNIEVYTDRVPQFFTSDNDEILRFDAIPSAINGLVSSSFRCLIYKGPTSRLTTSTQYFDLPYQAFPALTTLCVATAIIELKGDTQAGNLKLRDHKRMMASLSRNARLIDVRNDRRKWIIPRRTSQSPLRNAGNGFI
jgi:hypothetical protein